MVSKEVVDHRLRWCEKRRKWWRKSGNLVVDSTSTKWLGMKTEGAVVSKRWRWTRKWRM